MVPLPSWVLQVESPLGCPLQLYLLRLGSSSLPELSEKMENNLKQGGGALGDLQGDGRQISG